MLSRYQKERRYVFIKDKVSSRSDGYCRAGEVPDNVRKRMYGGTASKGLLTDFTTIQIRNPKSIESCSRRIVVVRTPYKLNTDFAFSAR